MKISGDQIVKAIQAVVAVTIPFAQLVFVLSVIVIALGILLGVVIPSFNFGSLQNTFLLLINQTMNLTISGYTFIISGANIALTLVALAVVFIVFAKVLSPGKENGRQM